MKAFVNQIMRSLDNIFTKGSNPKQSLLKHLTKLEKTQVIDIDVRSMIEGALQVREMTVKDIMIPKLDIVAIPAGADLDSILPIVLQNEHSRYPVYAEDMHTIIGILLAKDLIKYLAPEGKVDFNLNEVMRPIFHVPEKKKLNPLLREFKRKRTHMAIVVDEYGSTSGLITMEDIIERIVGDIDDEYDVEESSVFKEIGQGEFSLKASTALEEFNDFFQTHFHHPEVESIGGYLIRCFGHLPQRGETLKKEGLIFEVLQADSRRIQLIKVIREKK